MSYKPASLNTRKCSDDKSFDFDHIKNRLNLRKYLIDGFFDFDWFIKDQSQSNNVSKYNFQIDGLFSEIYYRYEARLKDILIPLSQYRAKLKRKKLDGIYTHINYINVIENFAIEGEEFISDDGDIFKPGHLLFGTKDVFLQTIDESELNLDRKVIVGFFRYSGSIFTYQMLYNWQGKFDDYRGKFGEDYTFVKLCLTEDEKAISKYIYHYPVNVIKKYMLNSIFKIAINNKNYYKGSLSESIYLHAFNALKFLSHRYDLSFIDTSKLPDYCEVVRFVNGKKRVFTLSV